MNFQLGTNGSLPFTLQFSLLSLFLTISSKKFLYLIKILVSYAEKNSEASIPLFWSKIQKYFHQEQFFILKPEVGRGEKSWPMTSFLTYQYQSDFWSKKWNLRKKNKISWVVKERKTFFTSNKKEKNQNEILLLISSKEIFVNDLFISGLEYYHTIWPGIQSNILWKRPGERQKWPHVTKIPEQVFLHVKKSFLIQLDTRIFHFISMKLMIIWLLLWKKNEIFLIKILFGLFFLFQVCPINKQPQAHTLPPYTHISTTATVLLWLRDGPWPDPSLLLTRSK